MRGVLVAVCVALGVVLAVSVASKERSAALANEPVPVTASLEETYAGWTQEQLVEALEKRKSVALTLKDTRLAERIEQGNFEEKFDAGPETPLALKPRADAVAVRVDTTPAGNGRIVRTTYVLRGEDAELDQLVDEINWLMARTGSSIGE